MGVKRAKGAKKTVLVVACLAASGGFQDRLTAEDPTRRVRLHGGKESEGCAAFQSGSVPADSVQTGGPGTGAVEVLEPPRPDYLL